MPETFDLDTAFRDLERDIAVVSTPLGAVAAVRGARRRRRTTIGAAAAGVALVAGAVAVGAGVRGHDDTVVPTDHLPAPAPFDGSHLTAATRGWTPAWGPQTDAGQAKFSQTFGGPCLFLPGHGRGGIVALANDHVDVAVAVMSDYGSKTVEEATDWVRLERQVAGCHGAQQVSSFSDPSGALGRTYQIDPAPSDSAPEYLWVVSTGREIGVLKVFGQSDPLPTSNDRPVAQVLLAAIQDPASYIPPKNDPSTALPQVGEDAFARAVSGWSNGWARSGHAHAHATRRPPCLGNWSSSPTAGASLRTRLGGNGHQAYATFGSAAEARDVATSMVHAFRACDSEQYSVARELDNPRSMLAVASGSQVVFVAQHDATVGVVTVPSAGSAPPGQVTTNVGGLMFAAITAFAAQND